MKAFISFELYVRDISATLDFFTTIFGAKRGWVEEDFAVLWFGKTRMALTKLDLNEFKAPNPVLNDDALNHLGSGVEVVLSIENIDEIYERLSGKVKEITTITKQPWGLRDFRFLLEEGYYIRVTEADEDIRSKIYSIA